MTQLSGMTEIYLHRDVVGFRKSINGLMAIVEDEINQSIQQVLPKSAIGKAIQYSLNQWDKLSGYIKSGEINMDNNRAE